MKYWQTEQEYVINELSKIFAHTLRKLQEEQNKMIIHEEELHAEAVKRNGSSQHIIKAVVKLADNEKTITFMDVTGRALRMKTEDVIKVIYNAYLENNDRLKRGME